MRIPLFLVPMSLLPPLLTGCLGSFTDETAARQQAEEQQRINRELSGENARLRADNVRLTIENLETNIRNLRDKKETTEATRVIVEEGLLSEYAEVRAHALKTIAPMKDEDLFPLENRLLAVVDDPDERVRAALLPLLARINSDDCAAVLFRAAEDPGPSVRAEAAAQIAAIGGETASARLLAMVADRDDTVKAAAIGALGKLKERRAVGPIIDLMMAKETSGAVIEKSIDALGAIGAPNALDTIVLFLENPSQGVRWSAINGIGRMGNPLYAHHLLPFLDGRHPPHIRQVALQSLAKLGDTDARPRVREILQRDPDPRLRTEAARYFAVLGDPEAIPATLFDRLILEEEGGVRKEIWKSILTLATGKMSIHESLSDLVVRHRLYHEAAELLESACVIDRAAAISTVGGRMAQAMFDAASDAATESDVRRIAFQILNTVYGTNHTIDAADRALADWKQKMQRK